jgi:DNA-directed RNA polymerase subunit RPC12/RpoP
VEEAASRIGRLASVEVEYGKPNRARVQCPGCSQQYDTWWTPIRDVDTVTREELTATRVVVCPHCGYRGHIGRGLALHGDLWRETTPLDSVGVGMSEDERQAFADELEARLRHGNDVEVETCRLDERDGAPIIEVVFVDRRVPGVRFGYRNHIWDHDSVVWWANFLEDTEACVGWSRRNPGAQPTEVLWLRP